MIIRSSQRRRAIATLLVLLVGCGRDKPAPAAPTAPRGPLAPLMTQHGTAVCGPSDRSYATPFWRPPYTQCRTPVADTMETVEIDADSMVIEVYDSWTLTPAAHAAAYSQAEADLTARFGIPRRCSDTRAEWRQGDTLDVALQVRPASEVGTEFDEGPWRLTRIARLGPLDPADWGC